MSVSMSKIENAASRLAKAFRNLILNPNNEINFVGMSLYRYLKQLKVVLFNCFNYLLLAVYWLHPF